MQLGDSDGSSGYAGDTSKFIGVWGVQLTEGSGLAPYVPTSALAINEGAPRPLAA